jgi:hypothetical protein
MAALPKALALEPLATAPLPKALALSPFAVLLTPTAVALAPVVVAPAPIATASVLGGLATPPPATYWAYAGLAMSATPDASTKLLSAPPASALVANRRLRRSVRDRTSLPPPCGTPRALRFALLLRFISASAP